MFLCALVHGAFSIFQFHALGDTNPLVSLFTANPRYASVAQFPFQSLGFFALAVLFVMAATSHDFWLKNLTAPVWKRIHMLVYAAYALLVAHVTLGALQSETSPILAATLGLGFATLIALHVVSGAKERRIERERARAVSDGFVEVCDFEKIPEKRAKVVTAGGERIAVFRYDGKVSAVSNVCAHQGGPLGEGRIIDGCITCPWHGYQYLPECGASPPPFTEKIPSYRTRVIGTKVLVNPEPLAPGTPVEPARLR
jgi:nitrite reductase/ring-hydroxylating ferredoxin subunit